MTEEVKNIEVEKKYVIDSEDRLLFEEIRTGFSSENFLENYTADTPKTAIHTDEYYDTEGRDLYKQNIILRIRSKKNCKKITIKKDVADEVSYECGQLSRFEYEHEVASEDMQEQWELLKAYCKDITERFRPADFSKVIRIEKEREKILFRRDEFCFEVAFDSVTYISLKTNVSKKEYQIEIELKSDYAHRHRLKAVTDELEKKYEFLRPNFDSKYRRAVNLTDG